LWRTVLYHVIEITHENHKLETPRTKWKNKLNTRKNEINKNQYTVIMTVKLRYIYNTPI